MQTTPGTPYRHHEWNQLIGAMVEVRKDHKFFRTGFVDSAMPDSSALWLAFDGPNDRILIAKAEGYEVWVEPRELDGSLAYRMTAPVLHPETDTTT